MTMSDCISLTVLTPEKTLLDIMVSKVELPGAKGRFMVLKNHIPLIFGNFAAFLVQRICVVSERLLFYLFI